jgi:hypothetical protein
MTRCVRGRRSSRCRYWSRWVARLGCPQSEPGCCLSPRRIRQRSGGWVNIAAPDDIAAARRDLPALFDHGRPDGAVFEDTWTVENGSGPHNIEFYLTKKSCGAAVAGGLS